MQTPRTAPIMLTASLLLVLALWVGCRPGDTAPASTDTPAWDPAPAWFGNVDEVIGPEGPVAATFEDAEYRQVRRPDDIAPIYDPKFAAADDTDVSADELVIGLEINGDARAYPAGVLYNREMVNDTVGGVPVIVTWCPLCYTALVHHRGSTGSTLVFGNQGALYKGAMTWYDHETGSVWSQPTGEAIAGPLAGVSLELIPSQLTTWRQWLQANPHSLVLSPPSPASPYAGRKPGKDHVVGVVVNGHGIAWPYLEIVDAGSISAAIGGVDIRVSFDERSGAVHAFTLGDANRELPVVIAYHWAWERFYPRNPVDKADGIQ